MSGPADAAKMQGQVRQRDTDMHFPRRAVLLAIIAVALLAAAGYAISCILAAFGSCWACGV